MVILINLKILLSKWTVSSSIKQAITKCSDWFFSSNYNFMTWNIAITVLPTELYLCYLLLSYILASLWCGSFFHDLCKLVLNGINWKEVITLIPCTLLLFTHTHACCLASVWRLCEDCLRVIGDIRRFSDNRQFNCSYCNSPALHATLVASPQQSCGLQFQSRLPLAIRKVTTRDLGREGQSIFSKQKEPLGHCGILQ